MKNDKRESLLAFLYESGFGRFISRIVTNRFASLVAGFFCDRRFSSDWIKPFVKQNGISLAESKKKEFLTFNDFFSRELKEEARPLEADPGTLPAPCDGLMTAVDLSNNQVFNVKGTDYHLDDLLYDDEIAKTYANGTMLIFRLRPVDFHRYIYVDDGMKESNTRIKGLFHSVDPKALKAGRVFDVNTREYTLMHTEHFSDIIYMEVGALFVGRIINAHPGPGIFHRGVEKGHFKFGGSTIILIFKENTVALDTAFFDAYHEEVFVKRGQKVARTRLKG